MLPVSPRAMEFSPGWSAAEPGVAGSADRARVKRATVLIASEIFQKRTASAARSSRAHRIPPFTPRVPLRSTRGSFKEVNHYLLATVTLVLFSVLATKRNSWLDCCISDGTHTQCSFLRDHVSKLLYSNLCVPKQERHFSKRTKSENIGTAS